ncbi:MAG: hypothetical protein LQ338_005300 [Usnochroma carphineum]|nr:MAG: hypothetical protein LQ338_005300 [Usnochroma carphineum]
MSLRSSIANGGVDKSTSSGPSDGGQEKQKKLLAADAGHFSMIKALHLADLITELNGFCGFMSVLSSMRYCLGPPQSYGSMWLALALMPFGLFFDFMDGKVARWRKKSSLMGQELDSLADLVSFGVAPAASAFALGLRTPLDTLLLAFFVLCALTRLARFNVTVSALPKDSTGKSRYFEGFPTPTSLSIVGGMAWCLSMGYVEGGADGVLGGCWGEGSLWGGVHPVVGVFVGWGFAMVSRTIHIPKP